MRQLRYEPSLDGIRGVAIALVMAGHAGVLRGGGLGVDLFFALSGFLITSLLLREWANDERIDLRAFYGRRARRLLPALALFLGALVALGIAGGRGIKMSEHAAIGALYVSNLVQAVAPQPGVFSHLRSLADEQQFYVLWPLALILLLRRKRSP